MRYLINGTTGLLGRNLLFEILKQNLHCLAGLEIIVLGKFSDKLCLECRMDEIIFNDGLDYLQLDKNIDNLKLITEHLRFIEFDLIKPKLGISNNDLSYLKKKSIDCCFHVAALTNFFNTPEVIQKLNLVNVTGTVNFLNLIQKLKIQEIIYIGTVYHAGSEIQHIHPDYINKSNKFRNPYEKSKLAAELYFINFCQNERIKFKVCRISTISGRLIEKPIGSVSKYDVFYEWAVFFLKSKIKHYKNSINFISEQMDIDLRILLHPESTVNIIPADYGAKLLYYVSLNGNDENFYHLVNETDISTKSMMNIILTSLNIRGHSYVNQEVDDKNQFEQLYYRSVGKIFTPYIIDPPLYYINDNLQGIIKDYNLECPEMNEQNFQKLIDYAINDNFGLANIKNQTDC